MKNITSISKEIPGKALHLRLFSVIMRLPQTGRLPEGGSL